CNICGKNVLEIELSDDSYEDLLQGTKRFLMNHLYAASEPQETTKFMSFVEKRKPYDIVVDTLNLLYSKQHKQQHLIMVIKKLAAMKQKVLLIGRKHVGTYLRELSQQYKTDYYIVQNWSNDDAFIMYAAFLSGRNTKVLSNDFMRNKFNFESTVLNILFKKWQFLHHYVINANGNWIKLYSDRSVDSIIEKQGNHWHIPYMNISSTSRHLQSSDWICI
ncbi:Mitochondrial ribonuclease P protein 3, partial [Eufriesea mexicana]